MQPPMKSLPEPTPAAYAQVARDMKAIDEFLAEFKDTNDASHELAFVNSMLLSALAQVATEETEDGRLPDDAVWWIILMIRGLEPMRQELAQRVAAQLTPEETDEMLRDVEARGAPKVAKMLEYALEESALRDKPTLSSDS